MAQWVRTLSAFPQDQGSILSTPVAAHNCDSSSRDQTLVLQKKKKIKDLKGGRGENSKPEGIPENEAQGGREVTPFRKGLVLFEAKAVSCWL